MNKLFLNMRCTAKKYAPEMLVIAGIGGLIAATVMACKATTKVNDILVETKDELDKIHETASGEEANEADTRKTTAAVYAKTGCKLVKLYGPSVVLGTFSIAAICKSHGILKQRNTALAAAYATLDQGFKKYKERVAERFGEDVEKEIRYGLTEKEIEEIVTTDNGKEKTVKKKILAANGDFPSSPYAKFFDESNINWSKDAEQNKMFLYQAENWANKRLIAKGHLTLNEVYEYLGIPETKAGLVVGWVYDKNIEHKIDFGVYNLYRPKARDFVNGYERSILLDFNVDGNIYDQMRGEDV